MKIKHITVSNFRQYAGDNKVNFSTDSDKNITVIEGENGAGKTNLFRAMKWCLFGEEGDESINDEEQASLPLLNENHLEQMEEGDTEEVSVEIVLTGDTDYTVNRKAIFEKRGNDTREVEQEFYVMEKTNSGWEELEGQKADSFVFRVLPYKIHKFYFFDGERLDTYFKPGTERRVKSTVEEVSQIDLLEQSIGHLDKTRRSVSREYKGDLGSKLEEKTNKIEEKDNRIEELNERLDELSEELTDVRGDISDIDKRLGSASISDVRDWQNERSKKEERLDELNDKEDDIREKLKDNVIENAAKIFALDALREAKENIEEMEETIGLPPDIQAEFVRALLDADECICGSDLDDIKRKRLKSIIEDQTAEGLSSLGMEGKYKIQNAIEDCDGFVQTARNLMSTLDDVEREKEEIDNRLQEISETLKRIEGEEDDLDIEELENKRSTLENKESEILREQGKKEKELSDVKKRKQKLEQDLSQLRSKESKNEELDKKMEAMERGKTLLEDVKNDIVREVKNDIEEKTEKQFFELIWKEFREVNITDDYETRVINKFGRNAINNLSAGERQALALSFMAALKQVSGYDFPVMIDTPLGRISSEPRKNIAENLPNYLSDTQVAMLVTDTEYDEEFEENISGRVGQKYSLAFDEETKCTEVIED